MTKLGLWPSTPVKPERAIDQELLQLQRAFLLEAKVPTNGFTASINLFNTFHPSYTNRVNHFIINMAAFYYKYGCSRNGSKMFIIQ